ncbi:MAG TPA: hypothetical protein VNU93_00550 [Verrucomicrobiae bacterium]|nr:hypothetical protein [Verrucomicrobiae bacterium]
MNWVGNCRTTAMGILPHHHVDNAMDLALSVDIPFWPQLPKVNFFEDMYVQASEHFPGITLDHAEQRINFSTELFYAQLEEYLLHCDEPEYLNISQEYSLVYKKFLQADLAAYRAIRGQMIGPVSFGMKITDENKKPIIYNADVKSIIYEFLAKKINLQYRQLSQKHSNAFMWVDEPGLEILFGSFTGYASEVAMEDYREFLAQLDTPIGIHLCGNPDWSFLLNQDISILSMDAFSCGRIFSRYHAEINKFLSQGRYIAWGIVPTLTEELESIQVAGMVKQIEEMWDYLAGKGVEQDRLMKQALLAPSRCCLVNADGVASVEKSFKLLQQVSNVIREKYGLYD